MRQLVISLLCFAVAFPLLGAVKSVNKLPKKEREEVLQYARTYLSNCGADYYSMDLSVDQVSDNLVFLDDWLHSLFILVARDSAASMLKDRTLAFSIGATRVKDSSDSGFKKFFAYYDRILTQMREGKIEPENTTHFLHGKSKISPLLSLIKWRQFRVPAQGEEIPEQSLTGCGATAVGQVLSYYTYPKDIVNWSETSYTFNYPHGDTLSITPLMLKIGRSIGSVYGVQGTSTNMSKLRVGMVRDLCYSPAMLHIYGHVREEQVLPLVTKELKAKRPVIVCGHEHIFICDGKYRDFYHFNMGWSGNFDGWYRLIAPKETLDKNSFFDGLVLGVEPDSLVQNISREIVVNQKGMLNDLLTDEQKCQLRKLKVSGPVNGADIKVLRQMSGYLSPENLNSWHGTLSDLDLSDAQIVADSSYYFEYDAAEFRFYTTWNKQTFHFDRITPEEWLQIKDAPCVHNSSLDVKEVVPGKTYRVCLKTMDDVVGAFMFSRCANLRNIVLPKGMVRMNNFALSNNLLLKSVCLPDTNGVKISPKALPVESVDVHINSYSF